MTTYLDPIRAMLQDRYPQPNPLWNYSADNTLDAGNWLRATPTNVWGLTYGTFKQAVPGDGPLHLKTCTVAEPNTTQLCLAMDASMTAPGQDKTKLFIGHSDAIVEAMYDVMISANVLLDITSLSPPTGRFLDSMANAVKYLSNKPDGQRPVVRVLVSNPLPDSPRVKADPLLQALISGLDADKQLQVYVYIMSSSFSTWNHAKIVAADGVRAVVGGHNQWGVDYLGVGPAHDVSMRVTGSAVRHAHDFANSMWAYGQWRKDNLKRWTYDWATSSRDDMTGYAPEGGTGPSKVQAGALPAPGMYKAAYDSFPAIGSGGSVPILAVGRASKTATQSLLPTLESYKLAFKEPSDEAIVKLVSLAQRTVRMSLQSFRLYEGLVAGWNVGLLQAISDAMKRGVEFYVVIANPGAPSNDQYVLVSFTAPYDGGDPTDVNGKLVKTVAARQKISVADAKAQVAQRFHIAQFRYSADPTYPVTANWPAGEPIGNHAKTVMVDDAAFIIGSQNMYTCNLNEFGYMVEDATAAQYYLDNYWTPLWEWSKSTVTTEVSAYVVAAEMVEAAAFLADSAINTLMNWQWSDLFTRHEATSDPTQQQAIEDEMDELITSSTYTTTAQTVLQTLHDNPPSTTTTPEATAFVTNLMNTPSLLVEFNKIVMAHYDSVDAYNAAVTKFLNSHGFKCTVAEAIIAFRTLRDKTYQYWDGRYDSWVVDDGGMCWANSSVTPAKPHALQARAAAEADTADAAPVPDLAPALAIDENGVTFDGAAIKSFTYNDGVLSWSASDGNPTSASVSFGTVVRPAVTDLYTGNEFFGTITYPDNGGPRKGTYSFYGRFSADADGGGGNGGAGTKSYTAAYVLGALALIALMGLVGYSVYKLNAKQQADWLDRAQRKRDSDRDATEDDLPTVGSRDRTQEFAVTETLLRQRQVDRAMRGTTDLAKYERLLTTDQIRNLQSSAKQLSTSEQQLENPDAEGLPELVRGLGPGIDASVGRLQGILTSVGSKMGAAAQKEVADNLRESSDVIELVDLLERQQEGGELIDPTTEEEFS
jgi:phosphatidylserine/phosphatidylglycerophosphate/cardiolipin synthase-like enzyme